MKKIILLYSIISALIITNNTYSMFLRRATALKQRPFARMCNEKATSFNYSELVLLMQQEINILKHDNKQLIRQNELLHAQINNQPALTPMQETIAFQSKDREDNRN